ncbi:hypothetical protein [Pseudolysinimonas kribbensis]|uniref:hypothetical protein n=1 Tax=Pseudolysinimonas kribbensis TaxID=433641 RepID=UPI0024E08EDF|nr:hypothetical protein [Pseudolysinimonas kribbensis]
MRSSPLTAFGDEALDVRGRGGGAQLGERAALGDGAALQHDDVVGERRHVGDAVRDDDDRDAEPRSRPASSARNPARNSTSRAAIGSSSSRTAGSAASARASATRCA